MSSATNSTSDSGRGHRRGRGRFAFWVLVGVAVVGAAWAATAEQRTGRGGERFHGHRHGGGAAAEIGPLELGFVARRLFPDDPGAQERFVTAVDDTLAETRLLRADGERLREAFIEALAAEELNDPALAHIRAEAEEVARRALDVTFEGVAKAARDLTAEQRREIADLIRDRR